MADESGLSPYVFPLEGGLVLNKSNFSIEPGMALELENFEPDSAGGYRRINGYTRWGLEVPYTNSPAEPVLMSAFYKGEVVAARGESVYRSTDSNTLLKTPVGTTETTLVVDSTSGFSDTGTLIIDSEYVEYTGLTDTEFTGCTRGALGTVAFNHLLNSEVIQYWTTIESGRVGAKKYSFVTGALIGPLKLIYCDGANPASLWDGSTVTSISGPLAPADPQYLTDFKNAGFYAGMSSNPQEIVYTAPASPDDFDPANGAGSFVVDEPVTGMTVFRDSMYIFSASRIYRLTGSSQADYVLTPITRNIGCRNGWTIKEFAGDIVFLGPDGLRTIAGTDKIGDVELGSISKQVQELFQDENKVDQFDSLVIPNKTQYRIFFSDLTTLPENTKGVTCTRKENGYEYATTKSIKPSCTDTEEYLGEYFVIFGGFNGYVYRLEDGTTFDGRPVIGRYRSADITAGDPGIRKAFQRIIINYKPEGTVSTNLYVRYDYESSEVPRPDAYPFDSTRIVALYGTGRYGFVTYGGQSNPLIRQAIEGSGFSVALRVIDQGLSDPYSLKGFQLEFTTAARR
jgi:hypothetical protein